MTELTMRERKKEATKAGILNSAVELINKNGFAETTMQLISKKADVALRTLYNYFPSKESIVATYIHMVVEEQTAEAWDRLMSLDTTYERLLFMCQKSEQWMKENISLTEVYAADPRNYFYGSVTSGIPTSGYEEVVEKVISMGQEQGEVTCAYPASALTRQYISIYYGGVLKWLNDTELDLFEVFEEGLDIFYCGIKSKSDSGVILAGMFF